MSTKMNVYAVQYPHPTLTWADIEVMAVSSKQAVLVAHMMLKNPTQKGRPIDVPYQKMKAVQLRRVELF
jgi:hypothetical protein